jgi:small glutamine-rich tetratricopeptide repeat-containing protein alpha
MDTKKKVVTSIIEYLEGLKADASDASNIETVVALLEEEFGLSNQSESFQEFSYYPQSLADLFEAGVVSSNAQTYSDSLAEAKTNGKFESFVEMVSSKGYFDGAEEGSIEYLKRHAKLIKKFKEKAAATAKAAGGEVDTSALEAQAEDLKFKGNAAINAMNYDEAIRCYTEALELSCDGPNSHVYHSNRAAAYCHQHKYQEAVDDCEACIALSPDYVKAHSRLGLANFFLGRYADAVSAYERAVELEPDNKASKDSLKQAMSKLNKVTTAKSGASSSGSGMEGLPAGIPPSMMKNPAVKQAMDQMGGPAGLANLMKDPQMMAMAQQMMKDPAMMQQAMAMMGGGGKGGGGMPDMSALAGLMGGLGGGGGGSSSSGAPSSSSAKKPFTGFED